MKRKVLIIVGYYIPSVKGGGPIQSIKNLVEAIKDVCDFYLLANDRDLGDTEPFNGIKTDEWLKTDGVNIYYTNVKSMNTYKLYTILKSHNFDVLYLNSFFSFPLSIRPYFLVKLNLVKFNKVIVAARGNFSDGALEQKRIKKKIYIEVSKVFKLYKNVIWHATSNFEKEDISRSIGKNADIFISNNLTKNLSTVNYDKQINKFSGMLKLVYIARIHPMKNLLQTLKLLQKIEGKVEFSIYGPIEDNLYWEKCKSIIANIGRNVKVNYLGQIANEKVNDIYKEHHVAILMTLGENFGHSIAEALIGGCPIIISDRTPWKNLQDYNAGYDISLENEDKFISAIQQYIKMNNQDYQLTSKSSFDYAKSNSNTEVSINSYIKMFDINK